MYNNHPKEEDYKFEVGEIVIYTGIKDYCNIPCKVIRRDWMTLEKKPIYRLKQLDGSKAVLFGSEVTIKKSELGEAVYGVIETL